MVFFQSPDFTYTHSFTEWENLVVFTEIFLSFAWNEMIICGPTDENKCPLSKHCNCGLPHLLSIL
jgi:hypothetical protein